MLNLDDCSGSGSSTTGKSGRLGIHVAQRVQSFLCPVRQIDAQFSGQILHHLAEAFSFALSVTKGGTQLVQYGLTIARRIAVFAQSIRHGVKSVFGFLGGLSSFLNSLLIVTEFPFHFDKLGLGVVQRNFPSACLFVGLAISVCGTLEGSFQSFDFLLLGEDLPLQDISLGCQGFHAVSIFRKLRRRQLHFRAKDFQARIDFRQSRLILFFTLKGNFGFDSRGWHLSTSQNVLRQRTATLWFFRPLRLRRNHAGILFKKYIATGRSGRFPKRPLVSKTSGQPKCQVPRKVDAVAHRLSVVNQFFSFTVWSSSGFFMVTDFRTKLPI